MRALSNTDYDQLVHSNSESCGLGRWKAPPGRLRRVFRKSVHYLSHKFILNRRGTRSVRAAGFCLAVYPTVFHPKLFLTSEFFARFLATLDLAGKRVVDVGTGSGILALAAARAGATVVALDINPRAVNAAADNARANGLGDRVTSIRSDLMSGLAPDCLFDVIISNPPFFSGEPRDVADRAWVAGPGYRDIMSLFDQARQRLKPSGAMYVLLSSDSDLHFLGKLIAKAGFRARIATAFSIMVESMIIYELTPLEAGAATYPIIGSDAGNFEDRKADNFVNRQDASVGFQDAPVDCDRVRA
jgi:release factor glutamine methyltransferase